VGSNSDRKSPWRIGALAKAAGVSADTLRHYERKGVLPAPRRTPNGYREYAPEALDRVRLIRRALTIGFTLDELSAVLKARDRGDAPCRRVRDLAAGKLANIEVQLADLRAMRDELRNTLQDWDSRLEQTTAGAQAGLLEAFASRDTSRARTSPLSRAALGHRNLKRKGKRDE
jgi:DNA-binding transcriptional MerR regulator